MWKSECNWDFKRGSPSFVIVKASRYRIHPNDKDLGDLIDVTKRTDLKKVKYIIGHVEGNRKRGRALCRNERRITWVSQREKRCKIYLRSTSSSDVDQFFQWVDLFFRKKVERKLCKLLSTRRLSSGRNEGWIKEKRRNRGEKLRQKRPKTHVKLLRKGKESSRELTLLKRPASCCLRTLALRFFEDPAVLSSLYKRSLKSAMGSEALFWRTSEWRSEKTQSQQRRSSKECFPNRIQTAGIIQDQHRCNSLQWPHD